MQTGAALPFYVSLGFMIYSGNNYQLISVSPVLGSQYALNAFGTQVSAATSFTAGAAPAKSSSTGFQVTAYTKVDNKLTFTNTGISVAASDPNKVFMIFSNGIDIFSS